MDVMRRTDGNRQIFVDKNYIGMTKYVGDGYLHLQKVVDDRVILELFKAGRLVGSKWRSLSLMGFTAAISTCSLSGMQNALSESVPENSSGGAIASNQLGSETCSEGPVESQALCNCEKQGFQRGTGEFDICLQSVIDRINLSNQAKIEDEKQRQSEISNQIIEQQRAEAERLKKQREFGLRLLGGILRGYGNQPRSTIRNCNSHIHGNTISSTCIQN
jgi:hypothetical protein